MVMQFAYIPTIGLSPYLPRLLRALEEANCFEAVWVVQNGWPQTSRTVAQLVRGLRPAYTGVYEYNEDVSLYQGWNRAIFDSSQIAHDEGEDAILHVFNDDIILPARSVVAMGQAMQNDSTIALGGYGLVRADATNNLVISPIHARDVLGTYRERGINGCAWALRLPLDLDIPHIDEELEWWGGDDDLVYQLVAAGRRCVLFPNIWMKHPSPGFSANQVPATAAAVERDRLRLLAKWGRTW